MTRRWTAASRRKALEAGHAMPPIGSETEPRYPIEDCDDVTHAVKDVGQTDESERPAVRRYVTRRAVELGCTDRLPDTWRMRPKKDEEDASA